jgi:hypothetical protein|tara:strand:+ start:1116 stop:1415 length:300 start_codon:yes stop_codon:yes gene_type:complete
MKTKTVLAPDYIDLTAIPEDKLRPKTASDDILEVVRRFYGQTFSIHQVCVVLERDPLYSDREGLLALVSSIVYGTRARKMLIKVRNGSQNGRAALWRVK